MKILWTSLTILAFVGLLLPLTIHLGWPKFALSCLLGFVAGISIFIGCLTSLRNRALITLLLGVLILPGLAVYLSLLAGSNPPAFEASSSVLTPFVAYALTSLVEGLILAKVWQNMPDRGTEEEAKKESVPLMTPALKEKRSHEGSDLNKAA